MGISCRLGDSWVYCDADDDEGNVHYRLVKIMHIVHKLLGSPMLELGIRKVKPDVWPSQAHAFLYALEMLIIEPSVWLTPLIRAKPARFPTGNR